MKILWLAPDEFGFRQYADDLLKGVRELHPEIQVAAPHYFAPLSSRAAVKDLVDRVALADADLVHVQHEYGFMGSKVWPYYRFPQWTAAVRSRCPETKIVATAHSVIRNNFKYPLAGRGWQIPARWCANRMCLSFLKRQWSEKTWGVLDGVIVHSKTQVHTVASSGCKITAEIPHYIPDTGFLEQGDHNSTPPTVLVFGYFTPEKGQDIVIEAMPSFPPGTRLILAGGTRRSEDRGYFEQCRKRIDELGLRSRVTVTGFVPFEQLNELCEGSDLIIVPFRDTSGSGSMAAIFSRGLPALASDHRINLEIGERVSGALEFFRSENPRDCAAKATALLQNPQALSTLAEGARKYAEAYSRLKMAEKHIEFYHRVLGSKPVRAKALSRRAGSVRAK